MQEVEIVRLDHHGRGIGKLNNKTIFIPNTLVGEMVIVKNVIEKKKFIEAEVEDWIKKSPLRVEPICPYFKECGGCDIMHMSYQNQLEYKKDKIKDMITRFSDLDPRIIQGIVSDKEFYYRNKVTFHVKEHCGLYQKKSYEIIPVEKCYLISDEMNELLNQIRKHVDLQNVSSIIMRSSNRTKEMMLIIELRQRKVKFDITFLKDAVTSIYTLYKKEYQLIYGKNYLTEQLFDLSFDISPSAFFQVNTKMCEKLYEQIRAYLRPTKEDILLDLYCGTGTIGLTLASSVKKVIGVEINSDSIRDANLNKEKNGILNASFYASKVSDMIEDLLGSLVVVDPPRAGLDARTIKEIKDMKPKRMVYVSCDPMTLIRDLNELSETFEVKEMMLFDMFPETAHVESVCLLNRR